MPAECDGGIGASAELLSQVFDALVKDEASFDAMFNAFDVDASGQIDKEEFLNAFRVIGYDVAPRVLIEVFEKFDTNGSGKLELGELKKLRRKLGREGKASGSLRRRASGFKGALPKVSLDEHSVKSVSEQIRDFLKFNKARVIDLFKAWDVDDDGSISKQEFRTAMALLGVKAHPRVVDSLFSMFDTDDSGELDFEELDRILRVSSRTDVWMDHSLAPTETETSPQRWLTHPGGKDKSRVLQLCDALGYPEYMSIQNYLTMEEGKLRKRNLSYDDTHYISISEARVDYLLHQRLPLPPKRTFKAPTHAGPPTPRPPPGTAPLTRQPRRCRPIVPPSPRPRLDLGSPTERWKEQMQVHWQRWEGQQEQKFASEERQFFTRRPWHAETYWPINNRTQSSLGVRWHEHQLKLAALSPREQAKEARKALVHIGSRMQTSHLPKIRGSEQEEGLLMPQTPRNAALIAYEAEIACSTPHS